MGTWNWGGQLEGDRTGRGERRGTRAAVEEVDRSVEEERLSSTSVPFCLPGKKISFQVLWLSCGCLAGAPSCPAWDLQRREWSRVGWGLGLGVSSPTWSPITFPKDGVPSPKDLGLGSLQLLSHGGAEGPDPVR